MRFIDLAQILKVNYVHDLRCQVKNFLWFATKGTIEYVKMPPPVPRWITPYHSPMFTSYFVKLHC